MFNQGEKSEAIQCQMLGFDLLCYSAQLVGVHFFLKKKKKQINGKDFVWGLFQL